MVIGGDAREISNDPHSCLIQSQDQREDAREENHLDSIRTGEDLNQRGEDVGEGVAATDDEPLETADGVCAVLYCHEEMD